MPGKLLDPAPPQGRLRKRSPALQGGEHHTHLIAAALFPREPRLQFHPRGALGLIELNTSPFRSANTAPPAHQAPFPEERRLDRQHVKTQRVGRPIDPLQDDELNIAVTHVANFRHAAIFRRNKTARPTKRWNQSPPIDRKHESLAARPRFTSGRHPSHNGRQRFNLCRPPFSSQLVARGSQRVAAYGRCILQVVGTIVFSLSILAICFQPQPVFSSSNLSVGPSGPRLEIKRSWMN